ncbi:MAG: carotenoid biosynthesis protein [Candidatus Nanopelagicales bacterium]|nr:carotenoid biosynthesis protein [Candidatus Nanopelagicales bacterium]
MPSRSIAAPLRAVPWLLGALGILSQIVWVLLPEDLRDTATITSVLLMVAAGASHAILHRGAAWAAGLYLPTAAIGFAVEALGTATGLPFGDYRYGERLGPMLLDVPLLIPLAWCMAAYPMLLLARRLASTRMGVTLIGAWTLMAWDLFLDPQMVGEGHWAFADPTPALPGSPGIPLTNYAGWFLTGLLIFWVLDHLPRRAADDRLPTVLLLWMYASNVLAAAVFFGRPAVALWGGVAMGLTVVPWARLAVPELLGPASPTPRDPLAPHPAGPSR